MDGHPIVAVVVPIRSFRLGKGRLAGVLSEAQRSDLSCLLAGRVIDAAAPLPVYVVSSDPDVRSFAAERKAAVVDDPGSLNAAAHNGLLAAAVDGATRVIIVHADLAKPTPYAWVGDADGVTIVPDRHGQGTNVMSLPVDTDFEFAYGDGSCARHVEEAKRCALAVRVVVDDALGWDVDEPDDLRALDV